jgi:hypothetical protein
MVVTAVRQIVATSKGRGCPCHQSRHMTLAFSLLLHNSLLYSAVHGYAALGGVGAGWQPLNISVASQRGYHGRQQR